jgi:hypothetical protein
MGRGGKYSHILISWYFYRPLLLLGCCSNLFQLRNKEPMTLQWRNSKVKPLKACRLQGVKLPLVSHSLYRYLAGNEFKKKFHEPCDPTLHPHLLWTLILLKLTSSQTTFVICLTIYPAVIQIDPFHTLMWMIISRWALSWLSKINKSYSSQSFSSI